MTKRRYSVRESINRLYRLWSGQAPPDDTPGTLSGDVFSEDEALSYLTETLGGSMPNVTGTFPPGLLPITTPDDYIIKKESGVFAYLATGTATTIASGSFSVYYPIQGPFVNSPFEDFTISVDQIAYDGDIPQWFEIDWHASVSINAGSATTQIGVKQNGILLIPSVMDTLVTTAILQMSGTVVTLLNNGDTIQLVMASSGDGNVLTVSRFTTTIKQFFY
jgi:hypothetical protein